MNKRKLKNISLLSDYGVDFISKDTVNGTYHAGQAKHYTSSRLCAGHCATFINVSVFRFKKTGYLYTSKDCLEPNLKEDIKCSNGLIEHIVHSYIKNDNIQTYDETCYELRNYQVNAISAIVNDNNSHGKSMVQIVTGGGKTLIAAHALKRIQPNHIICFAPLLVSVEQIKERLSLFLPDHKVLLVDSEGTTNVHEIIDFINSNHKFLICTTFKSSLNVMKNVTNIDYDNTFLVVDEVHNIVNNIELCDFCNMFKKSLYLSATVPEELSTHLDFEEVYSYGIGKAIEQGYCVDYEIYVPYIVDNKPSVIVPQELNHLNTTLCNQALFLATGILMQGKRRCIAYMNTIEECDLFMEVIREVFDIYHGIANIWTEKLSCDVPKMKRKCILNDFESGDDYQIKILCNVRILNEAVDIVRCDSQFVSKVGEYTSDITIAQRLGRGLRLDSKNPSKKNAMFIWCDDWENAVNALTILKEDDYMFHSKLRVLNSDYAQNSHINIRKNVEIQLGNFNKFVEVKCLTVEERWELRRLHWVDMYRKLGNKPPSQKSEDPDEKRAGQWQGDMRKAYKKKDNKRMTQERIDALNNHTEGWKWENDDPFEENRLHWVDMYRKLGNKSPSSTSRDPEEKRAGQWQGDMRKAYKKKDNKRMTQERIDALNNHTEGWKWKNDDPFEENRLHWVDMYRKLGNKSPSSISRDPEEKRAGIWQSHMRQAYKKKDNKRMTQERIDALNNKTEGWKWENDDPFEENRLHWVDMYRKLGNKTPSKHSKDPDEKRAGQWQGDMRKAYKKKDNKRMTQERIDALNNHTEGWKWECR